jgi:ferritin
MTNDQKHASNLLSYAAGNNGFAGIANFLFRHAAEERNHDENTGIYFK